MMMMKLFSKGLKSKRLKITKYLMVKGGNRKTTVPKLIANYVAEIQKGAEADGLWQTVQPGLINEKRAQCFPL